MTKPSMTFPPPAFQVGDIVRRKSGAVGIVTEVRRWSPTYAYSRNSYGYKIKGDGFHPKRYFFESVLSAVTVS